MTDLDDLIARLLAVDVDSDHDCYMNAPIFAEAAAALEALRDEVARKVEAAYREGLDKGIWDGFGGPENPEEATKAWMASKARAALAENTILPKDDAQAFCSKAARANIVEGIAARIYLLQRYDFGGINGMDEAQIGEYLEFEDVAKVLAAALTDQ